MVEHVGESGEASYWDRLVERLQLLRERAGNPSYGDIAQRVSVLREGTGMSAHAARVARTTVYDSFRLGRSRLNLDLYRDTAKVLGATDDDVDSWLLECRDPVLAQEPEPVPEPSARQVCRVILGCLLLNIVGREVVDFLHLPIYLDMVGTAIAAIALGPWFGALVGGGTNLLGSLGSGSVSLPFALVNIVGALVWGYGVRRFGWGLTLPRFFWLNALCAVVCSLIAVPILMIAYGGSVGAGQDNITATVSEMTSYLLVAVSASNIVTSLGDKIISGFVALVVITVLPLPVRRGSRLVVADPEV
ncbi:ECF transporter S component [Nocardioides alcanivorans]|uniref:ECF transporter S component n=1 Tax=Nocardioides alcanivorans TaxID=2897352 RepID=UPI001F328A9A|nr:ECF transporter S component [Nocardioides alcanivorans]